MVALGLQEGHLQQSGPASDVQQPRVVQTEDKATIQLVEDEPRDRDVPEVRRFRALMEPLAAILDAACHDGAAAPNAAIGLLSRG